MNLKNVFLVVVCLMAVLPGVYADTIIVRSDDAMAWWSTAGFKEFHDRIQAKGVPVTVCVIPTSATGYRISTDPTLQSYLWSMSNTEFAMHGYLHSLNEFATLSESEADAKIKSAKQIFYEDLAEYPTSFCTPYGLTSVGTLTALKNNGFTAMGDYYYNGDRFGESPSGLYHVPMTAGTYDWSTNVLADVSVVESACDASLASEGVCVISLHFHKYLDASGAMTDSSRSSIDTLMNYVVSKAAAGTSLLTYSQYAAKFVTPVSPVPGPVTNPPTDLPLTPPPDVPPVSNPGTYKSLDLISGILDFIESIFASLWNVLAYVMGQV